MTTREAFVKLISEKGIHHVLKMSAGTVRTYKNQVKTGKGPSMDLMEEMLMKAGWVVKQEKVWGEK